MRSLLAERFNGRDLPTTPLRSVAPSPSAVWRSGVRMKDGLSLSVRRPGQQSRMGGSSSNGSYEPSFLDRPSFLISIPFVTMKRGDSNDTPRRRSKCLVEQARIETLRQWKITHRGHEVRDTQEDPLFIPSDEEMEVVVRLPPKSEVSSPVNPDYDSNYLDFLAKMEAMAEETPANIPPTPPQAVMPDASPSSTLFLHYCGMTLHILSLQRRLL
nr:hypothetical protein Iba_chr05aCG10170 [Ipomoea batatas]